MGAARDIVSASRLTVLAWAYESAPGPRPVMARLPEQLAEELEDIASASGWRCDCDQDGRAYIITLRVSGS
jgi:hypothetical protein